DNAHAEKLLQHCLNSADFHSATDEILDSTSLLPGTRCLFLLKLSESFAREKDHLTATQYLRVGRADFDSVSPANQAQFLNLLVQLGRADEAADITIRRATQGLPPVPLQE